MSIALLILMSWLGGESGASLPWSHKWQNWRGCKLGQVPEMIAAVLLGGVAAYGYGACFAWFVLFSLISYAGIQSATWMFLQWTKHTPNNERSASTKPLVDWLAGKFGRKLGDEGYSWTAAAVKGFIATLPLGGTGALFFPLGYELGSHIKGKHRHAVAECASFFGLGLSALLFLLVAGLF